MKRRSIQLSCRVDNSLAEKVKAIKAEGYGRLSLVLEDAIKNYPLKK